MYTTHVIISLAALTGVAVSTGTSQCQVDDWYQTMMESQNRNSAATDCTTWLEGTITDAFAIPGYLKDCGGNGDEDPLKALELYGLDVLYSHHTLYTIEYDYPLVLGSSQPRTVDLFKFFLHRFDILHLYHILHPRDKLHPVELFQLYLHGFDILRLLVKLHTINHGLDHVFKFL
ncbi:hypothetical protein Daus18300_009899 [Diaporthe australafricana]|uniref:Uncharacterized protein n=1 Tax=Diaporthe australafricana TaxID=127596 RepID=A0ABR3WCM8_9PEZI